MFRTALLLPVLLLALGLAGPARAASPAETCGSAKLKAAAGYVPKLLGCSVKAAGKGLSIDPACVSAADALLTAKHGPTDTATECVIQRDTAATRMQILDWSGALHTSLGADGDPLAASKCDAARLKSVLGAAKSLLGAYAASLAKPKPESLGKKVPKAFAKLTTAFAKTASATDCSAVVDVADVSSALEAFVASLVTVTDPANAGAEVVASPRAFHTNTPTEVRVEARVPVSLGEKIKSVKLHPLLSSGYAAGPAFCTLFDDGNLENGDDIAGDRVYSCLAPIEDALPTTRSLAVVVSSPTGSSVSREVAIHTVDPLTQAQAQAVVDVQAQANTLWQAQLGLLGDTLEARQAAAADVLALPEVVEAGVSSDDLTLWYLLDSGVRGGLALAPAGTRGGAGASAAAAPSAFGPGRGRGMRGAVSPAVGSHRVLVWDAFASEFGAFDEGPAVRDLYEASACPLFEVDHLVNSAADIASVLEFTNYGTVVLVTHGALDGDGDAVFLTRESATLANVLEWDVYLILQELTVMNGVLAVRPEFVRNLPGFFDEAMVYAGSCHGAANSTLADAFFERGASAYFGYDGAVHSDFAEGAALQLFTELSADLDTTATAFAAVVPATDPTAPNANIVRLGAADLAYSPDLRNGGFESGTLAGWERDGDGRVIQKLGAFAPRAGEFMGIISTGLGFTTASGAIEQGFCLDPAAATLRFDWNFSSEELVEYCGTQFDDPFVVELVVNPGEAGEDVIELFRQDVDSVCDDVNPTKLYFDQSAPGCVAGAGNDCLVHSTGWREAILDISGIAATNGGEPVVLRLSNTDSADSIYDSAVLLDGIEVQSAP
jgi:hypothetical protein